MPPAGDFFEQLVVAKVTDHRPHLSVGRRFFRRQRQSLGGRPLGRRRTDEGRGPSVHDRLVQEAARLFVRFQQRLDALPQGAITAASLVQIGRPLRSSGFLQHGGEDGFDLFRIGGHGKAPGFFGVVSGWKA